MHRCDIERERPRPGLVVAIQDRTVRHHAGGIHQDVERALCADQGVDRHRIEDVQPQGSQPGPRQGRQALGVDVGRQDVRALAREGFGGRPPDPRGGGRDQGASSGKSSAHGLSSQVIDGLRRSTEDRVPLIGAQGAQQALALAMPVAVAGGECQNRPVAAPHQA